MTVTMARLRFVPSRMRFVSCTERVESIRTTALLKIEFMRFQQTTDLQRIQRGCQRIVENACVEKECCWSRMADKQHMRRSNGRCAEFTTSPGAPIEHTVRLLFPCCISMGRSSTARSKQYNENERIFNALHIQRHTGI